MPDDLPFVPDATLDLVDVRWWLELRRACGRSTSIPHKMLTKRHGARARVPDLLARLRCSQCGSPPARAEWVDNPAGGASGSGFHRRSGCRWSDQAEADAGPRSGLPPRDNHPDHRPK